ncbi:MAG: T9SS type A sorting domain-containing protein [Bacteroidota bacterium]
MTRSLLLILLLSTYFIKAQHYVQGLPVDTVIYTGMFSSPSNSCSGSQVPDITLATNLNYYVDGLQFMMLVDSVVFAGPPQFSPVHAGDTVIFDAAHAYYSQIAPIYFYFRLKLVGTPTTAGQTFPCQIEYNNCTCNCYHLAITSSSTDLSVCTVDISNGVTSPYKSSTLTVFPNPSFNTLSVSGIKRYTHLTFYNSLGVLVEEQDVDSDTTIHTGALSEGVYTLFADNATTGKKIVITK